jgi:hypothetical protein
LPRYPFVLTDPQLAFLVLRFIFLCLVWRQSRSPSHASKRSPTTSCSLSHPRSRPKSRRGRSCCPASTHSRRPVRRGPHSPVRCAATSLLLQFDWIKLKGRDAGLARCSKCDLKENLWLCLTSGALGCGRKLYSGAGRNGHALAHPRSVHIQCV